MKRLLLSLAVACPLAVAAQTTEKWMLVDQASGAKVEMGNVGFLLASDDEDAFAVVCNDGTIINGATAIAFSKEAATGISGQTAGGETPTLSGDVNSSLTLSGLAEGTAVNVYTADGREVISTSATGKGATVNVSGLSGGVYLLKAGKTSVKFIKK